MNQNEDFELFEEMQLNEIEAWHGSFRPRIGKFKPFSHFGSEQAARDRLSWMAANDPRFQGQPTGYLYKLDLGIDAPARVKDYPQLPDIGTGSLAKIAAWARDISKDPRTKSYKEKVKAYGKNYKLVVVDKTASDLLKSFANRVDAGHWRESKTPQQMLDRFIELCRKSGIDGLVYRNQIEAKGKDSYIAFSADNVRIIGRAKPVDLSQYAKTAKSLGSKVKIKN